MVFSFFVIIYAHAIFGKHYIHMKESLKADKDVSARAKLRSLLENKSATSYTIGL